MSQFNTEKYQILATIKSVLQSNYNEQIKDIILFGSQANLPHDNLSDYDILIVLKNDYDWKFNRKLTDILFDLEIKYNILIDKHVISINELNNSIKGAEPIYQNALKNGVYL